MNVITMDYLNVLDDESLNDLASRIKKQIRKFNFSSTKELEVDLCYVQREQEIRFQRQEHAR